MLPSRPFTPIAVVGRALHLPGGLHSPAALWAAVSAGRDLLSSAPAGRWRAEAADVRCAAPGPGAADRTWSDRGGYLDGLPALPETGLPDGLLASLDPLTQLAVATAAAALDDARVPAGARGRVGAILGNLSFPSAGLSRFAEQVWLGEAAAALGLPPATPTDRFMSGLPALLLRPALGLGGPLHAIDAACASSLYAVKLAADALHDGRADWMLAGAVNRCDDLFIHVGFSALQALSKTGQSRPFHAEADGLVPAEGAAVLVLRRLEDALRDGDTVYGVIRGVGLSNDGRARGLLAPSAEGQERALRLAWQMAGRDPAGCGLLECHATGTPVGDATELQSSARVFAGAQGLPIGSLKSNLGHLITAAGVAALIKVMEAMAHRQRPPTLHVEAENPALAGTPFRLLRALEPWEGPLRAGVSAFGFGGNNAHVVIEALSEAQAEPAPARPARRGGAVAVVALGARAHRVRGAEELVPALQKAASMPDDGGARPIDAVELPLVGLRFPPADLHQTLGQQTALLAAADEALRRLPPLPRERTAVYVGMGADAEVARYGWRWRLPAWGRALGLDPAAVGPLREAGQSVLQSAGVVGTMPNIPANRINSQFDLGAGSLTFSAEEASGLVALEAALRALREGELDAALVGAVDLCCEPVATAAAAAALSPAAHRPGDAAVALVLLRAEDAAAQGLPALALIEEQDSGEHVDLSDAPLVLGEGGLRLEPAFGHAHAAAGLLHAAAAVALLAEGQAPAVGLRLRDMAGGQHLLRLRAGDRPGLQPARAAGPQLRLQAHPPAVPPLPAPVARPVFAPVAPAPGPSMSAAGMPRAPRLPSALSAAAHPAGPPTLPGGAAPVVTAPVVTAPVSTAPVTDPPVTAAPLSAPPTLSGPAELTEGGGDVASALAAELARVSAVHRAFLDEQTALHQRFLALRGAMGEAALRLAAAPGEALPAAAPSFAHPQPAPVVAAAPPPAPLPAPVPTPASTPPTPRVAAAPASAAPVATAAQAPAPAPRPAAPPAPPAAAKPAAPPAAAKPVAPSAPASAAPGGFPFTQKRAPVGPRWGRAELQINASGAISTLYGPMFEKQDGFVRQCRMPEPPLLLADRVVGLDAVPGSMGLGTIWTETDVTWDSWYLHQGRMPAGVLIEAGQADLMLISYLGIDLGHPGDRVYRLLGCTLTYHGDLPKPGETLRYDIHVDGHAKHGDVRLFFFHYDCFAGDRPILSVRGGQAGFFTDAELEASAGILWTPESQEIVAQPRLDAPTIDGGKRSFSAAEVRAAAEGRVWEALGPAYDRTRTHVDTPRVQSGRMLFLGDTVLDPKGGPWGRGYLKSVQNIQPDDWFFDGHFKNDPCMPGTLMFEGCLQAMALYLTAMGVTADRDGWRFQPVPGAKLDLRCRGQVDPGTKVLTYELFVEEFEAGPTPTLWADILCTSDERKAFHARRVGLQLVADWPAERRPGLLRLHHEERPVATQDGFTFGYPSLLACAWGRPSDAFGQMYRVFDGHRRVARLPGPPYHFMSRVNRIDGKVGEFKPGAVIELEYDVPRDAWYFGENDSPTMPFCVFLEAALQPCGWLASMVGSAVTVPDDLSFRNLDGVGTMLAEIGPEAGVFRTRVKITKISTTAGMIIEGFDVACFVGETQVYELQTVFGFFPKAALENQVGLPTTPEQRAILSLDSDVRVDLKPRPAAYFGGALKLPGSMLCMIDRVTGYWPSGGPKGLGAARAEKDVDASEWFFKAHFFQDPVQPGSLGIEAMIRLLQWVMIEQGMGEGMASPRFEPLEIGGKMGWKYRGQVIPTNKVISTTIELTAVGADERGRWARCDASLWVDGKRIYEAKDLGMRVVEKGPAAGPWLPLAPVVTTLDPALDRWVGDHRPTWTVPALPMMSLIDLAAQAAGGPVRLVRDARVRRWVTVSGPTTLRAEVTGVVPAGVTVQITDLDKGEVVFICAVERREQLEHPAPWAPVQGAVQPDPYASGALFHGPAFQLLRRWVIGAADGAGWFEGTLDLDHGPAAAVPRGALVPALLDAGTHILPHDALAGRVRGVRPDEVAYPAVVERLELFGPAPTGGIVRVVAQALDAPAGRARFRIQWSQGERVWAEMNLAEALFPKGPLGSAPPDKRRAFLRDRRGNGLALSTSAIASCGRRETTLSARTVVATDWLPGTVAGIYGTNDPLQVAEKEHMAAELLRDGAGPHPGSLPAAAPLARWTLEGALEKGVATVKSGPPALDLGRVENFWRGWFNRAPWPVEDLYYGLMQKFIGQVLLEDPAAFAALRGRSVLFLANHQTGIESLLFSVLASALIEVPTVTVAKAEHRHTWLGDLIRHSFAYPGVNDPQVITYFDREDKASLLGLIGGLAEEMKAPGRCVMVHVEGTRALDCTRPVEKMSGAFIDMALAVGAPIVPVRFVGGLDRAPLDRRTEFPVGMGRQDIWFGAPLLPEELGRVPYGERKKRVIDGINRLGPTAADEQPAAADPAFAKRVADWQAHTGCREEDAVLFCVLEDRAAPSPGTAALLAAADEDNNALHVDPTDPEQLWLGQLARAVFGPRGPAVRGG